MGTQRNGGGLVMGVWCGTYIGIQCSSGGGGCRHIVQQWKEGPWGLVGLGGGWRVSTKVHGSVVAMVHTDMVCTIYGLCFCSSGSERPLAT